MTTRVGLTRRLQALRAVGWSTAQLARLTGLTIATINHILTDDETPLRADTRHAILDAYRLAQHRLPPNPTAATQALIVQRRNAAAAAGWATPWAWHDIDTDPRPRSMRLKRGCDTQPLDDAIHLLRLGVHPEIVADRMGIQPASLARRLRRAGHTRWARLAERRPHKTPTE